jgi:hypothetical protein
MGKKRNGDKDSLDYFFAFLRLMILPAKEVKTYKRIIKPNKCISLGLIFEKINGYKDGSHSQFHHHVHVRKRFVEL